MRPEIDRLLLQIRELEEQVEAYFDRTREQFRYTLEGHRVRFAGEIARLHQRYRTGILAYLLKGNPLSILTAPLVYVMVIPLAALDLMLFAYQQVCFRIYGIRRVRRGDFVVIDRHRLGYLNGIEKFNCVYCGYANGLLAYAVEVAARTEQYWCPIRHARRAQNSHRRQAGFLDYGDAEGWRERLQEQRDNLPH